MIMGTLSRDSSSYQAIFERERLREYPMVDAFEQTMGYALERAPLEAAARVLACPLKAHNPNWQHGRVIYAATRQYLAGSTGPVLLLDIGTAKGFSALCLQWALTDAAVDGQIVSLDVIDPLSREPRNSVAECDGPKRLAEILAPWALHVGAIRFLQSTGQAWLQQHEDRVHVVFVDGKHTYDTVRAEAALLAARQQPGDLAIFDDVHIYGVAQAIAQQRAYEVEYLEVRPERKYAIGRRR